MNRWGAIMALHKAGGKGHGRNLLQETRANEGIVTPFHIEKLSLQVYSVSFRLEKITKLLLINTQSFLLILNHRRLVV